MGDTFYKECLKSLSKVLRGLHIFSLLPIAMMRRGVSKPSQLYLTVIVDAEVSQIQLCFFLFISGGLLSLWKKHWCVLRDDTFMWFRGKQV